MAEAGYRARRVQAIRDSVTTNWRETAMIGGGSSAPAVTAAGAGAPLSVVGALAAVPLATTAGKMLKDAIQAVRQQPREALSTLDAAVQEHVQNPSQKTYQELGRRGKDFGRVGRAFGALEAADQKRDATVNRATGTRDKRVKRADRKLTNKTARADNRRDSTTRGVKEYLGDRAGNSGQTR